MPLTKNRYKLHSLCVLRVILLSESLFKELTLSCFFELSFIRMPKFRNMLYIIHIDLYNTH